MRRLKDRDFLRTFEGFLFCVVGYSHPQDRVISYLKYVPNSHGRWRGDGERYTRTMPSYTMPDLLRNIELLEKTAPKYVFFSSVFNIRMSAVPHNYIAESYFPEVKLQELLNSKTLDPLQEAMIDLVYFLSGETGLNRRNFGITGSILTDIHSTQFSDIDLTVYGKKNAWKIKKFLQGPSGNVLQKKFSDKNRKLARWIKDYPLTIRDAEIIYTRRWNYGSFKNRPFSIHAVRNDEDIMETYGENCYIPLGMVESQAEITAVDESLFLPCIYKIKGLTVRRNNGQERVDEIVSYDGFYAGLFNCGEHISVRGKLEMVKDKRGRKHFRVVIGSPEAEGRDYIKLLTALS